MNQFKPLSKALHAHCAPTCSQRKWAEAAPFVLKAVPDHLDLLAKLSADLFSAKPDCVTKTRRMPKSSRVPLSLLSGLGLSSKNGLLLAHQPVAANSSAKLY